MLNRKLNHLRIAEFTTKLYAPFKSKEEDMKNAAKTAMLLVIVTYLQYYFVVISVILHSELHLTYSVGHFTMALFHY